MRAFWLLPLLLLAACKADPPSKMFGGGSDANIVLTAPVINTERWEQLANLAGSWRFRIGDDMTWATDDKADAWSPIATPLAWEDAGFAGYDGYAWYQTRFTLSASTAQRMQGRYVYLRLGRIDDADEVYLNGRFLGSTGRLSPEFQTAYDVPRLYRIPWGYLDPVGENVLAVRVYDADLSGGILEGPLDLVLAPPDDPFGAPLVADLAGRWHLQKGDDAAWAAPHFDDAGWPIVTVPARWDGQGLRGYDGPAWYRVRFKLAAADAAQPLVLVLGAVDDLDETFVNGQRVGHTGNLDAPRVAGNEWVAPRAYPVPRGLLHPGENVLAVRVYDQIFEGGIYAGPVGLMTAEVFNAQQARAAAMTSSDNR